MTNIVESASTFNGVGTTVITNTQHKTFQIRLSSDSKEWLAKQENRQWLHNKLNAFLDSIA